MLKKNRIKVFAFQFYRGNFNSNNKYFYILFLNQLLKSPFYLTEIFFNFLLFPPLIWSFFNYNSYHSYIRGKYKNMLKIDLIIDIRENKWKCNCDMID